jgi:hypothetical protein
MFGFRIEIVNHLFSVEKQDKGSPILKVLFVGNIKVERIASLTA